MTKLATKEKSAVEAYDEVRHVADSVRDHRQWRFSEAASPGDYWRQGDVFITLLDGVPKNAKPGNIVTQLAEGNTQGSRHCLDDILGVSFFALERPTALDGPVLQLTEERTITHPEHGAVCLPPGTYGITYEREMAEELRRVAD